ncbi:MAG: hypothetical protein ACOCV1_03035, partial [Bacillota bacterium]
FISLVFNPERSKNLLQDCYDIMITKEEYKKLWNLIIDLKTQNKNKSVKFISLPCDWSLQNYSFTTKAQGSKIEIKYIMESILKKYYEDYDIKFIF